MRQTIKSVSLLVGSSLFLDNSKNIPLMSISFSVRPHQPKWRLVSEYQHCNFISLSDIYPYISPFTTMLNVRVDMGKLHCGIQTQQWNNGKQIQLQG